MPKLNVTISDYDAAIIEERIHSGRYTTQSDYVRELIRKDADRPKSAPAFPVPTDQQEAQHMFDFVEPQSPVTPEEEAEIMTLCKEGFKQIAQGEIIPGTPEFYEDIKKRGRERHTANNQKAV